MLWYKALHLISMVCWFAGLFYMFRLFVYHAENKEDQSRTNLLKTMSYRLLKYITTPAMVCTYIFGFLLLMKLPEYVKTGWFILKFSLIILLSAYHGFIGYTRKRFEKDDVFLTSKQCRLLNEVPTILLISIIFLAVLKPF